MSVQWWNPPPQLLPLLLLAPAIVPGPSPLPPCHAWPRTALRSDEVMEYEEHQASPRIFYIQAYMGPYDGPKSLVAVYYCIDGTFFRAPTLYDVAACRIVCGTASAMCGPSSASATSARASHLAHTSAVRLANATTRGHTEVGDQTDR